jgi:hypothetical protein
LGLDVSDTVDGAYHKGVFPFGFRFPLKCPRSVGIFDVIFLQFGSAPAFSAIDGDHHLFDPFSLIESDSG